MGAIAVVEELLRRVIQRDVEHAVALFEHDVLIDRPAHLAHLISTPANLCAWLADLVADGSPLATKIVGEQAHAALVLHLLRELSIDDSEQVVATLLVDTAGPRITRAHLLDNQRGRARLSQAVADLAENAILSRYLSNHRRYID